MRIMYKCIYIIVDNQGVVYKSNESVGITGENIQGRINISFREVSQTVEGIAYLEYKRFNPDINDYEKGLIKMDSIKDDEGKIIMYSIPILSSLLKYTGNIEFQLRITENEIDNYIPVYKSQIFNLLVLEAIDGEAEIPEEYPTWLDTANEKIQEIDNINISSKETDYGVEIDITNKEGVTTTNKVYNGKKGDKGDTGARGEQGIPGENGKDGYVQYQAGDNITIENNVISASGGKSELYTFYTGIDYNFNRPNNIYQTALSTDKRNILATMLCNIITDAMTTDNKAKMLLLTFNNTNQVQGLPYILFTFGDNQKLDTSRNTYRMISIPNGIANRILYTYYIDINGSWENNVFSVSSWVITKSQQFEVLSTNTGLSKTNTKAYTPTNDYNPATKKYVDDNKITKSGVLKYLEEENIYILTLDNNINSGASSISNGLSGTNNEEICGYFAEILNQVFPKQSGTLILNIINTGYSNNLLNNGVFKWDYGSRKFYTIGIDGFGCRINYLNITFNTNTDGTYNVTNVKLEYTPIKSSYTPTDNNHVVNKKYVDDLPKSYTGYDATKTQVLKNINGVLTWVTEV